MSHGKPTNLSPPIATHWETHPNLPLETKTNVEPPSYQSTLEFDFEVKSLEHHFQKSISLLKDDFITFKFQTEISSELSLSDIEAPSWIDDIFKDPNNVCENEMKN